MNKEPRPVCPECGKLMTKNGKNKWAGSQGQRYRLQRWGCQRCGRSKFTKLQEVEK